MTPPFDSPAAAPAAAVPPSAAAFDLTSADLLRSAMNRVRFARPELSRRLDLTSPRILRDVRSGRHDTTAADTDRALAVVVIGRLDLPSWVRETCAFALALAPGAAETWRRSFTRTVYLAGSPANLRERFAFDHVAADGSAAWAGPADEAATATLRRLLKSFEAPRELAARPPVGVTVPGRPKAGRAVRRDLYVATARVSVTEALVHLNHLLAEAAMDRLIGPGDRLTLRFVPRLTGREPSFARLRVDADVHRPDVLQPYAGLTEEI
ncbi:DUF6182 family protein [Streptomyces sp. NPDC058486]|uniref:DUF6182 family protein n=1 Tax=unclassified Streptomyces TaxID=2593676 RepID=UPI00366391E2